MAEDENNQHPLSGKPDSPMWKTFLVTDLTKVERTSGELHARLQQEKREPGSLFEAYAPKAGEKESEKKDTLQADVYPDAVPEHMRDEKEPEAQRKEPPNPFKGREVLLRPVISDALFPLPPKPAFNPLPSRDSDLKIVLGELGPDIGKPGILISKLKLPKKEG